ncbi:MAG: imidazolonepropionase [Myxococcales bacterium]|nr:imidazolonepropionase [Myxococcales bacterium]
MACLFRRAHVVTCAGPPADPLGAIADGALLTDGDRVAWVGPGADALAAAGALGLVVDDQVDLGGRLLTPGLIDCHTHAVFAGDRAGEFALRAAGASYQAIAAAGGGIVATTAPTRAASIAQLTALALARLERARGFGTTTIEIKTGYDLTIPGELRLLDVIAAAAAATPIAVVPTLLCHLVPAERRADRDAYVRELRESLVPQARGRATSVDVYCDDGAFTLAEARAILGAARAAGLAVRAHVGQFADLGGAELVAELGGLSIDHVEQIGPAGIAAAAAAGTVAVMLPGACVQLRLPVPPIAALRAAGVPLAIATDLNPGSSLTENLPLQMWLATTHYAMTVDEAWLGVTRHAARALGLADRGVLAPGARADLCAWDAAHPAEVPYHYGAQRPSLVAIAGQRVELAPVA